MSELANALGVKVNELFLEHSTADAGKELLNTMSEDLAKNINFAMTEVFKRYLG
jgi:hypothetical protein